MEISDLKYDHWMETDEKTQKDVKKTFQFKGNSLLAGYIIFIIVMLVFVASNVFSSHLNLFYIIFFLLMALAGVAGMGNQVKLVRQMKNHRFLMRDGIVKKVNYTTKRHTSVMSYDVEVNDHNVSKTLVIPKGHRKFKPKQGDHVIIVRPDRTSSIYFYRRLEEDKTE